MHSSNEGLVKRGLTIWAVLFGVIVAFYALTFSFRNITDTDLNSFQTRALALHGDVDLSRYRDALPEKSKSVHRNGALYSTYGVGVSVSAFPIYAVVARLGASDRTLQAAASIPFVAGSILIMLRLLQRLFSRTIAVGAAVIYGFGTTMWPVAAMAFFQNGPAALFQTIGLTGLFSRWRRAPVAAGFGFAAAGFVRPTLSIPLVLVGVLYLIEDRRAAVLYAAGAAPAVAAVLIQNRWIWGSWLSGGYAEHGVGFHGDMVHALYGLLVGWWRGLFVYSPVLVLAIVGVVMAIRERTGFVAKRLIALGVSAVAIILVYSRWNIWYGGTSQFGYRLLIDIVPFLVLLVAYGATRSERVRSAALALGVLSVLIMAVGAAPSIYGWETGAVDPRGITDTSLGQSWIGFAHRPLGTILRMAGVVVIGALMFRLAPDAETRHSETVTA
jgi:hypothetical protein